MTVAAQAVARTHRAPDDVLAPVREFLSCPTPEAWVAEAGRAENLSVLLIDHANCEKKAASTALNLMYRYTEHPTLLNKMSRLAREELRHFEQVLAIMQTRHLSYPQLTAARYASGLRDLVRRDEPLRLVDTLLVGALIEARSCERFAALLPVVDEELGDFYFSLLRSESRHFMDYLRLAEELVPEIGEAERDARLHVLRERERELIESADTEFRFHSGVPVSVSD